MKRLHELHAWLAALLLVAAVAPANAAVILVQEELGFGFLFSGTEFELEQGGPPAIYDLSAQFGSGALFDLRYEHDFFFMTALADNTVATAGSLPFGIDVYPGDVAPISPAFPCGLEDPCYNGLGFLPWFVFPLAAGEFVSLEVPARAVGEPAAWTLLALAVGLLGWARQRAAHPI